MSAIQQGSASAWFYAFITSLGGRLTSLFFTLSSFLFFVFEWEGEMEEACIVFSADKGLESKEILADLNDVLKSPT